jgi:DNA-binding NarL/FixJ family response regulator
MLLVDRGTDYSETLLSAAEGETVHETAVRWGVSDRYVHQRRNEAVKWLGAKNITHAVYLACRRKILH